MNVADITRTAHRKPDTVYENELSGEDTVRGGTSGQAVALLEALDLYYQTRSSQGDTSALSAGRYTLIRSGDEMLVYHRDLPESGKKLLVALNLASQARVFSCDEPSLEGSIVVATTPGREGERISGHIPMRGNEAVIVCLGCCTEE